MASAATVLIRALEREVTEGRLCHLWRQPWQSTWRAPRVGGLAEGVSNQGWEPSSARIMILVLGRIAELKSMGLRAEIRE